MEERIRKNLLSWLSLMKSDIEKISNYEIDEEMVKGIIKGIKSRVELLDKMLKINERRLE